MAKSLRSMYLEIKQDHFPKAMELSFVSDTGRQTLFYEKASWTIDGEARGLRYGENPDQEAAMYRLVNGNLVLGETENILPGQYLASDVELLQSGKHPGKINITDVDSALNILRYLSAKPCAVIMKHNNPSGVAWGSSACDAFVRAYNADRIAAFGGALAINRPMDLETAKAVCEHYMEVVAAPEFEAGVLELFAAKKNIRVMRIRNIEGLERFVGKRYVDFKSLIDGGLIVQWSYHPQTLSTADFFPAQTTYQGKTYATTAPADEALKEDMLFGWLVEAGVTSNSVIFVKNGVTVGIGTGEQDRVGVAEIARDKAYKKCADRICFEKAGVPLASCTDETILQAVMADVEQRRADLKGSIMVSDAFFPFRDGVDVGLKEGIAGVVQPGGALRDWEVIEACNQAGVPMMFTGQRSFKH